MKNIVGTIVALFFVTTIQGCVGTGQTHVRNVNVFAPETTFYFFEGKSTNDPLGIALEVEEWLRSRNLQVVVTRKEIKDITGSKVNPSGGTGTGFFVSNDGLLVTNAHVIDGATQLFVVTTDGLSHNASLITSDPHNDIALLRVENPPSPYLQLAPTGSMKVGEEVHAIGYPMTSVLGKTPRITKGIINATVGIESNPSSFQFSAQVQPGNSGGPVLNDQIRVVGITTSRLDDSFSIKNFGSIPQDINFGKKADYIDLLIKSVENAIPMGTAVTTLEDAISATALILVDISPEDNSLLTQETKPMRIAVELSYQYYWDVFVWQVTSIKLTGTNIDTGEVVLSIIGGGDSLAGKSAVMTRLFAELDKHL